MKKLTVLILCIAALMFTAVVTASAEVLTFTFDTAEKVETWVTEKGKDAEFSFDEDEKALKVTNVGLDPYICHDFDQPISADTYKYVVYRFKLTDGATAATSGQFFFSSDTVTRGKPGTYTSFSYNPTSEWQEVVFDLSKLAEWKGQIVMFRLDHVQGVGSKVSSLVQSISFTTTNDEAMDLVDSFYVVENKVAPEWILDDYNTVERFEKEMDQFASIYENNEWKLTVSGSDPKITFRLTDEEKVRASEYPYAAFRMRTVTTAAKAGIFFLTSTATSMGKTFSEFDIKDKTGAWTDYIIDLSSYPHGLWNGTVDRVRLDVPNPGVDGTEVQIDRFGLFATEEEAKAFLAKEVTLNIIEGDIQEDESKIINTGAKTTKWDLRTEEDAAKWEFVGCNLTQELGFYSVTANTTDARILCEFEEDEYFDSKEFHYFAMRYKCNATVTHGGLFFTNEAYPSPKDDTFTTFRLDNTGTWKNLVLDMNETDTSDVWDGTINGIRIDFLNPSPMGSEFTVSRIGFFRSIKEANEFLNGGSDEPDYSKGAVYTMPFQNSIVPAGALYEGFKREDFLLANANGENVPETAVVTYTNNEGNESIVSLSNVNKSGYASYVARKPGVYKISPAEAKDFVDTKGHWGESYIDYVSTRKLFGGTSETEFSPEQAMTRGMFITVLGRMHGLDTSVYDGSTGYTDVAATEYYAPYIQWAKEFSIMAPVSDTVFGAETPILRKDMAIAIANYVKAYDYDLDELITPVEFNDVAALTDSEKAAIKSVQASAIINGKGEGVFDPMGVSTRAEVATVMQRVIKSILGVTLLPTQYDEAYFDRDRIRIGIWGFYDTINNEEGVKTLADLGADLIVTGLSGNNSVADQNRLLNYTDKYGIEVYASGLVVNKQTFEGNSTNYKAEAAYYDDHPSFNGHYFTDEPGTDNFGWMGDMANEYQAALPGKLPFVNLLPMYANAAQLKMGANAAAIEYYDSDPELYRKYCEAWFDNYDVDYICTDIYPLNESVTGKKVTRKEYIEYINVIATVAREHDAEFWCCIQTFGWTHGKRTPNEAEYRWQCYSMLSFGCTGILLWNYMGSPDFPSLVSPTTLKTTPAYDDCKPVMWEMRAISDAFVQYKNLGVYTVNCVNGKPDYLAMTGEYKDFATIASLTCEDPLLIGCFTAKEGDGKAFTITNMTDFQGNEDKITTVSFVLDDMNKTVTSYYRGTPTVLTAQNGAYTIDLECGDGVFITVE